MSESRPAEVEKLETAFAQDPEGRAFAHLAEAYRREGDLERARDLLEGGLARHPEFASGHVVHGRVLRDLRELNAAEEAFRVVVELDARNVEALRALGDMAKERGDAPEALRFYRDLRALEPFDEDLLTAITTLEAGIVPPPEATIQGTGSWEGGVGSGLGGDTADEVPLPDQEESVEAAADGGDFGLDFDLEPLPGEGAETELAGAAGESEETPAAPHIGWESEEWLALREDTPPAGDIGAEAAEPTSPELAELAAGDAPGVDSEPELGSAEMDTAGAEAEVEGSVPEAVSPAEWTTEEAATGFAEAGTSMGGEAAADDAGMEGIDVEVVTETMGELYASQGLYQRAAEVFRSLLRDHPENERWARRLQEVEERWTRPGEEEESSRDAWLEGVEAAWTGGAGATPIEETPYAWSEAEGVEEEEGEPVADYFASLLGWRVGGGGPAPVPEGDVAGGGAAGAEETAVATGGAEPAVATPEVSGVVGGDAATAAAPGVAGLEAQPEGAQPVESVAGAVDLEPAEEVAAPAEEPDYLVLDDVVEESGAVVDGEGSGFARPAHEPADSATVEAAFKEWFDAIREGEEAVGEEAPDAGSGEEPDDGDDDLETFRNWLQSLKQ